MSQPPGPTMGRSSIRPFGVAAATNVAVRSLRYWRSPGENTASCVDVEVDGTKRTRLDGVVSRRNACASASENTTGEAGTLAAAPKVRGAAAVPRVTAASSGAGTDTSGTGAAWGADASVSAVG